MPHGRPGDAVLCGRAKSRQVGHSPNDAALSRVSDGPFHSPRQRHRLKPGCYVVLVAGYYEIGSSRASAVLGLSSPTGDRHKVRCRPGNSRLAGPQPEIDTQAGTQDLPHTRRQEKPKLSDIQCGWIRAQHGKLETCRVPALAAGLDQYNNERPWASGRVMGDSLTSY